MAMPLPVGTLLKGYCHGHFGRDSYDDKRVEGVGVDWVVVRNEDGKPEFACAGDWEAGDFWECLAHHEEGHPDAEET